MPINNWLAIVDEVVARPPKRNTYIPPATEPDAETLRAAIDLALLAYDELAAEADEKVASGWRRAAATANTQPRAAREMYRVLKRAVGE